MKPVIFIPDGNWYLHRIFHTMNEPKGGWKGNALRDGLVSRLMNTICADAIEAKATHLAIAFDGNNVFRYEVYPMYKSSREERDKKGGVDGPKREVYRHLEYVIDYFRRSGIPVIQLPKYEADDVMSSLAYGAAGRATVLLGSRDKDLYQCLSKNVLLFFKDSVDKRYKYIGVQEAMERLGGISIEQMVEYQMLIGDSTDDVPQAKAKMGPKTAQKLLLEYGTIRNCYDQSPKDRKWLITARSLLQTNRKLVTMVNDCYRPKLSDLKVKYVPSFEHRGYHNMCQELGFKPRVSIPHSRGSSVESLLKRKRRFK